MNNITQGQFECDVTCFVFASISFVHMLGAVVVPWFVYVFKLCKIGLQFGSCEIGIQGQRGGKILDVDAQGGRGLENRTIFMNVIVYYPYTERVFMMKQPSKGFFKKDVIRSFAKLTQKNLCRNLIF